MTKMKSKRVKPAKPEGFPLTPSPNGHWVKKIKGKVYNFGRWDEPDEALKRYLAERHEIETYGCRPVDDGGIRLDAAIKLFLDCQRGRRDGLIGKPLSDRHFDDLKATCFLILKTFSPQRSATSLRPENFRHLYQVFSVKGDGGKVKPSTIRRNIANVKTVFNWLAKEGKLPRLNYGSEFVAPVDQTAQDTVDDDKKEFLPAEAWAMIEAASVNTRAMVWLAINTGANNSDCRNLTLKAVDFENKVLNWRRWKVRNKENAKVRSIPLWPETVEALKESLANRPTPKTAADKNLFFITRTGQQWGQWALTHEIKKLKAKLNIDRDGVGFNSFRNIIETYGGTDQVAVNWIMGHIDPSTAVRYRNGVPAERVKTVTDSVRAWLGEREGHTNGQS